MASQMAPLGATSDIALWQQEDTAIEARNNSDLSSSYTRAQMLSSQRNNSTTSTTVTLQHATDMEARNNADLSHSLTRAQAQVQLNRARATQEQYHEKEKLWQEWCLKRGFRDNDIVTPAKLILWLETDVIPTGNRSKGKKNGAILSVSGLEAYIKPVVALYEVPALCTIPSDDQTQMERGYNTHGSPRTPALKGLIKYCKNERKRLIDEAGLDRGKDIASTYKTPKEFRNTVDAQMRLGTLVSFRTRMDLLMSQYMMLRGEDRRHCEFPDLFFVDAVNEAANGNTCILVLRLGQGKVYSSRLKLPY
jgi:hypothetical protein